MSDRPVSDNAAEAFVQATHDSARLHVSGAAPYIDDIVEPVGCLHVAPGLSPKAAGRITKLDLEKVRAAPGVVAVLAAADTRGRNDIAPVFGDDPLFADENVIFHGQVIFAVVAETREQARRAARRAHLEISEDTPILTVEDAQAVQSRVLPDYDFVRGEPGKALGAGVNALGGRFSIGGQEHFYLEGQAALAIPGEAGGMHVYSSTQDPTEVQHIVARVLNCPDAFVSVETRRMGGGFGGKETQAAQVAVLSALAAKITGRPCKTVLDRDDDFVTTGKRHDFVSEWQAAFDNDGRVSAYDSVLHARCGCSVDLSVGVVDRAMFHAANCYFIPDFAVRSRRWKTNTVSATAFRGFGGPQGMVAIERAMEGIAQHLGHDPLDVRRANLYAAGKDVTPFGMKVTEPHILAEILTRLEQSSDYRARRAEIARVNAKSRILKRGIALTPVQFGISFTLKHLNQAGALIHVYQDGSIHVNHGGTEMGQGLHTKIAAIVAREFGVGIGRVRITATHTGKVPNASPTAASSGTDLNGMAARNAVRAIRTRMANFIAQEWQVAPEQIEWRDDKAQCGNHAITFADLAKQCRLARVHLSEAGYYATPKIDWDRNTKTGRPFFYFSYGAACSEVVIDTLTGEMKVLRTDILHDVGETLNEGIDRGQIEGGFVQGMGWLTTEELVFGRDGRLLTHAPSTYKIPVASDIPDDFRVDLFHAPNREETVFRSKAIGEPPVMLAISVFCAILDAVHSLVPRRQADLHAPATPEAILRAVNSVRDAQ